ncbi:MAG: LysM peptidoglycan-binding domain-containing protein [Anaerolineae bacterium]
MKNRIISRVTVLLVILMLLTLLVPVAAHALGLIHIVRPGDTLYSIARRYGTTVWAIAAVNGLRDPNYIYVGQRLIIPISDGWIPPVPCGSYYIVRPGDTLYSIARRYGTTIWAIMIANGLRNPNYIWVGQRLLIPCGGAPPSGVIIYIVQPGDTLYSIARRYGTCVQAIVLANRLPNPNYIWVGQRLIIPN